MKTGLIGYTGFVGSNLSEQKSFSEYFNSSNIEKIKNHEFDMLICAGLSGTKYKINKKPIAVRMAAIPYIRSRRDAARRFFSPAAICAMR